MRRDEKKLFRLCFFDVRSRWLRVLMRFHARITTGRGDCGDFCLKRWRFKRSLPMAEKAARVEGSCFGGISSFQVAFWCG